jgi:hypothetical protein
VNRRSGAAIAAGLATLSLVASVCALAWSAGASLAAHPGGVVTHRHATLTVALLATAFACYLAALWLLTRAAAAPAVVLAVAAAIQLTPLAAPLLASTDAWTYWAYGRLAAVYGENPYATAPSAHADDPAYRAMGSRWHDRRSLYGPGFTLASEPLARAAGGSRNAAAWEFKTLSALSALSAAALAGRLTRRRALAVAFVGWNPLLAVHLAGGGHNDGWVGALILAALALAVARRKGAAGVMWALAVAVKWVPLVFLALRALAGRARHERLGAAGLLGGAAGMALLASWRYGWRWFDAIAPLAENAHLETRYAVPHRLEGLGIPRGVAIGLAAAVLAIALLWLARQAACGRPRLAMAAAVLLVTTPYLAVWYLAWAVPLAAVDEHDRVARASVLALCAYLLPQTLAL